ncbi:hypothetical protein A3862_27185 [Methylobacterium sp. XJLW]|uniref:hypothetical protein n=1 Tax=Methylobacterium sp. XJLW TaxID=739141 RepID=UPI000DAB00E8|nr:hypothetical protein [Methylobacterium sp. XJLW]AWV18768.1 hypothetical protein A3862_27185 [Methylobacterium sp. XJLW]
MAAKNLLSFHRRAWVIPNGSGMLWTDRIFDTEAEAQAHVDAYWAESGWTTPKHKPIEASVRVSAKLALLTQEAGDA